MISEKTAGCNYRNLLSWLFIGTFIIVNMNSCKPKNDNLVVNDYGAKTYSDPADAPVIHFETETFNFGKMLEGSKASYKFKYRNNGKKPLIILEARASCGCTIADYPYLPIAPGKESSIDIAFNSRNKIGIQDKIMTITTNGLPATIKLHMKGLVIKTE